MMLGLDVDASLMKMDKTGDKTFISRPCISNFGDIEI